MSGLEQAIRNALERAERSDPDIRARIYQSARNALDLGLRKQDIADPAVIARQRQRLEATIREIEDEELARLRTIARFERVAIEREPEEEAAEAEPLPGIEPPPVEAEPVARVEPAAAPAVEPLDAEFEATRREEAPVIDMGPDMPEAVARREPVLDEGSLSGLSATRDARPSTTAVTPASEWDDDAGKTAPPPARRGRLGSTFVSAFVYLFLFGIIGGGVWWVYDTGMVDAALKGSSDFKLVPDALRAESNQPEQQETRLDTLRGFSSDWINIYKPGVNAGAVTPRDSAAIGEHRDSDGLATIITSNAPDQDGDVLVEVPASLLQDLAGKTSTIAVTVKSNGDKPAQIYVQCEFKTLGDCGRHRYTVTNERADELIQVKFEGRMGPSDAGHIVINSDLTGEGASIRLYGIRVLPGS
ncbi:MAG: hypothetical protein KDJ87_09175 [Rhizobiaceae bacterium]|nr:hypothetical protein [Rhizobiaceae bacterium]